ncbi:hypothetical protein RQP46_009205 [Phenoliferia psychrophenolica]
MFAVSVLTNAYGFQIIQTTLKIEGAISALVYDKCARLASADSGSETGTVLSVASSDPAEIAGNLTRMLSPVRVTLQLVLSFASLYQLLGIWVLPGVIVLVLTSPAAKLIARITSTAVEKQLEARDKRTRLMNDILAAMRTVKLYSWETPLAAKLSKIRNDEELLQLSRQGLWTSIESGFGNLAPFLVGFASFSSFAAFSGRDLTADIAFPSLALVCPLFFFPDGDPNLRADRCLQPCIQFELLAGPIQMIVPLIRFFSYIGRGEFLAVSGRVGAGKTTLLAGILGDALKLSGSAKVYGSIAYADQHPYIIGASVRDNVVFGRELDEACSLARAAYSKADVILLDDTLSAVDAHVATHILEKLLGPTGLLRDTTRILSTHLPRAWEAADRIVLIQEGTLLEKSPEEVKQLVSDEPKEEGREIDSYATEIKPEADGGADVDIVAPTGLVDATGAVSRSVFSTYLNWCTPLGHWTEAAGTTARSLAFWLGGYITLGFCASVMIVVGSYFALSIAGVRSARTAFDQAFAAVVKSPLYFFDTTPIGAIQNRFLGDIGKIEITLAETVQYTLLEASSIFASLIVISASAPLLLILVAPLALLYRRIQRQYLATSQEVNRIAASQRGPVLSSFQETLTGGPTIRAFGQEKHFRHRFFLALTRSQEASFINDVMNHWLWLRLMALFRAIEIESGSISIDGVNIKSVGSRTLRSRLTILPQEAQFFQASLRLNLDPTETATDIQLWDALEKVGMKGHVEAMDGGLDAMVTEHASSFSSGQRQLIGIARALLRNSKILLVDEATSSIDIESDTKIQAVIRKAFPRATIIIIAHRIETVLDCDKILVMDGGQCVEFDTPAALLARKGGKFAALVKQSRAGAAK